MRQILLLLFAMVNGVVLSQNQDLSLHWNLKRGYSPFHHATPKGIIIENTSDTIQYDFFRMDQPVSGFTLDFRAANLHANPAKKYPFFSSEGVKKLVSNPKWGFFLNLDNDTIIVSVNGKEMPDGIESEHVADINIFKWPYSLLFSTEIKHNINPYDGDNLWNVNFTDNSLRFRAGTRGLLEFFGMELACDTLRGFGFFAGWGANIKISDINLKYKVTDSITSGKSDIRNINEYMKESADPIEGLWTVFDRDLEETLLKLGGDYTLASIRENEKYYFYYLDGANISKSNWKEGDIKIILSPSPFPSIFNVIWYDSQKQPLSNDIKAQQGEGNTLIFQFPYQSSKLRLRKLSDDF